MRAESGTSTVWAVLRARADGVEIDIHAAPRASKDAIAGRHGDRLKIHLRAAPVDGQANAALIKFLAKQLGLRQGDLALVRGHSGKRKCVSVRGLDVDQVRARLGLGPEPSSAGDAKPLALAVAALGGLLSLGCTEPRELPVTVLLPADSSDLERADNASIVLRPSGTTYTFAVDGLDFALQLEGEPSTEVQQLELYLAEGDTLLAWGSTSGLVTAGADIGLALFLGRPGRLSTWPSAIEAADPDLLATRALGRGMLLLETNGDAFLLNQFTLELESGARAPDAALAAGSEDGGLFSSPGGSVIRLVYETVEPAAWRYDPSTDAWTTLTVDGAGDIGLRPGAATLVDPDGSRLYILGGGLYTDAIAIDLEAVDGRLGAASVLGFNLDRPRPGGRALWLASADDPSADALVVGGGDDPDALAPIAVLASTGASIGEPTAPWTGMGCALLQGPSFADESPGFAPDSVVRCLGGTRDGAPTRAGLTIRSSADTPTVEIQEDLSPVPIPEPLMFADPVAVYAQGEGRWLRVDRASGELDEPESSALRGRGGHLVSLATGVTFQVGGVDTEGASLDRWQVFTPALEP